MWKVDFMARNVHIGKTSDGHGYFIAGGARITLYEDYLEWDGGLMNRECANIYYSDIISVTYTNGDFFVNASFQISTAGKNYTIRMTCAYANLEVIANAIERERAKEKNKQSRKAVGSSISVSDEIIKFSQLKEQGIISQQEFEEAKKQLLATGINPNAPVVKKQEPENVSDYHYVEEERVLNIMTKLPENQYTSGSPILILSGTLLKETPTSNILLQLVFQNLSYKDIVGVKITVQARDTFGEPLEGYSGFQYRFH